MAKIFVTNHFRKHLFNWGYTSQQIRDIIRAHHNAKLGTVVPIPRSEPRQTSEYFMVRQFGRLCSISEHGCAVPFSVEVIK